MAHELMFVEGRAQMFSVRETPWHREGTILSEAPTFADALRIGGLDYEVIRAPTYLAVNDGADHILSAKACVTRRVDTGAELGMVTPKYEVVQNREAFAVLEPLVDSGVLALETGGVLRDGADAWLLGRWDLSRFGPMAREAFRDEVLPYATVCANHSGRRGILLGKTSIRIVCANTLGVAEGTGASQWETIRHDATAGVKLVEAAETMFRRVVEQFELVAEQYEVLRARALTEAEFRAAVLDVIAPMPQENPRWNPEAKMAEAVIQRAERKRERLRELWTGGTGHRGDGSAWEAYNGAVEALDHDADLWPTRGGVYRTASLLDGTLATMKGRTLAALVELAR